MDQVAQPAVHLVALAIAGVAAIGIGVAVGLSTRNASADLTNNASAGIAPGLLFGVCWAC